MKYTYTKDRYLLGVVGPAVLAFYFTAYNFIKLYNGTGSVLNLIFFSFCLVAFVDYVIALSNPKEVEIKEDEIIVRGFAGQHTFKKEGLEKLLVRRFYDVNKVYVRIGKSRLLKGRYWIQLRHYSDGDTLLNELLKMEDKLHPMLNKFQKRSSRSKQTV